jgi:hypothetical protein
LGPKPAKSAKTDLAERRERLDLRIKKFMRQGLSYIKVPEDLEISNLQAPQPSYADLDGVESLEDEEDYEDEDIEGHDNEASIETIILALPSSFSHETLLAWDAEDLAIQERELRLGQANDALELLRDALATKAMIFRTLVRNANSQMKITKSWAEVEKVNVRIKRYVGIYRRARAALVQLKLPLSELETFKAITKDDLKMSSDIVEENRVGQRNDKLAWFWSLGRDSGQNDDDWMEECKPEYFTLLSFFYTDTKKLVYRVNWLRAKARLNRWEEEVELVNAEMCWTVKTFEYNAKVWHERAVGCTGKSELRGRQSYALQQENMWLRWGQEAKMTFFDK